MTTQSALVSAPEPWMRRTHQDLDSLRRGVVHALELALEDAERWAANLNDDAIESRPASLPSVAFHLRHMVRSLDRLLTYAEDRQLSPHQLAALATEHDPAPEALTLREFRDGLTEAIARIKRVNDKTFEDPRGIGRARLPTTVGGLLLHCAEHTQRHAGQMVTTAKLVQQTWNV